MALVLALVVVGAPWCIRRGEWAAPIAALVAFAIWVASDRTQSPYVAAKALVILTRAAAAGRSSARRE